MKRPDSGKLLRYSILSLLAVFLLLNLCWKLVLARSYSPELGGFERNVIWGIQQLISGNPLYTNPEEVPFSMIQYMPLYYYLVAGISSVTGILPEDAHSVYTTARITNLLITIGMAVLIFFLLNMRFRTGWKLAVGAAAFAFLLMQAFTISGRPDTIKAFFFLAQVYLLCYREMRFRKRLLISITLSILCFLSKQDGITSFGILPLALFFGKEWQKFFTASLAGVCSVMMCLYFLTSASDGWFWENAFGALQNGISLSWFKSVFLHFFAQYALLFAPALVLAFEFSREKGLVFRLMAAAFFLAFFPPLLASLKYGSGPNYFLEAILLSCILVSLLIFYNQKTPFFRFESGWLLLLTCILLFYFSVPAMEWTSGVFLNQEQQLKSIYFSEKETAGQLRKEFPQHRMVLLTKKQWEDNQSTLLWDVIINPNRDVSEQVITARNGDALHLLRKYIQDNRYVILLLEKGSKPSFPGLDFSKYQPERQVGSLQVWVRN